MRVLIVDDEPDVRALVSTYTSFPNNFLPGTTG